MQTVKIDGTTYHVKFDRDPLELAKLARKAWHPKLSDMDTDRVNGGLYTPV